MTQVANLNQFSHHTTTANEISLHYVIGGKGEPVLLWHGYRRTKPANPASSLANYSGDHDRFG